MFELFGIDSALNTWHFTKPKARITEKNNAGISTEYNLPNLAIKKVLNDTLGLLADMVIKNPDSTKNKITK